MIENESSYIVPKFPSSFPSKDERKGMCGMYALKAVIEWYNGNQINNYRNYASGWFSRKTWYMLPWGLMRVLRQSWLPSKRIHCRWMKKEKKIEVLKSLLHKWPVILLISHAYNSKRNFSFRRAFTLQHYISLRWYDDEKRIFYVYDSNTEKTHHKWSTLPVGNIILEYDRLFRYWRLGGRGFYRNFGISSSLSYCI